MTLRSFNSIRSRASSSPMLLRSSPLCVLVPSVVRRRRHHHAFRDYLQLRAATRVQHQAQHSYKPQLQKVPGRG